MNPASHPISVTDYDTTPDGDKGEDDTTGDDRIAVTVVGAEKDTGNEFVDAAQAAICGNVTSDTGSGLASVTLELEQGGTVVQTTLTDDSGEYCFDVDPGNYTVVETNLDSYPIDVSDLDAEPDGDANDGDTSVDNRIEVSVELGETDSGNNFVDKKATIEAPASISGSVKDSFGAALVGVKIKLLRDADDSFVAETSTDTKGDYIFNNVIPGEYKVMEEDPAGYVSVSDFDRSTGESDNDPDGASDFDLLVDNMIAVTLEAAEDDEDNDFEDELATISTTSQPIVTTGEPDTTTNSPLPPCGTIKITEIMYDPSGESGGDKDAEWIEIYNIGCNNETGKLATLILHP